MDIVSAFNARVGCWALVSDVGLTASGHDVHVVENDDYFDGGTYSTL